MLKINKVENEENLILKEYEPITLTEIGTGIKRKLLLENKEDKQSTTIAEEFFNMIICLTSITRKLTQQPKLSEKDAEVIETQKQLIIQAIALITDTLNLDKEESYKTENKKKKQLKEELIPVEYLEYDVIPLLRFTEIQANLNTVIEGYMDVGENLTYEKTRDIATDLTRIENALDNIGTTLSEEVKQNLIYKK